MITIICFFLFLIWIWITCLLLDWTSDNLQMQNYMFVMMGWVIGSVLIVAKVAGAPLP